MDPIMVTEEALIEIESENYQNTQDDNSLDRQSSSPRTEIPIRHTTQTEG